MRRRSTTPSVVLAGVLSAAAAVVAGFPAATASSAPSTSEPIGLTSDRDDGVLRLGLLLPQSGGASWIGLPASAAARDAVNVVNAAGGFGGEDVELISEDEGSDAATASAAIDRLIAQGVDAVIGPASSNVALSTLDQLMAAGVMTCSPSATSLLLDSYPERDLFFRTVPSDSLQIPAIAAITEREGRPTAVVYYRNDQYGQGLSDVLSQALAEQTQIEATLVPLEIDDEDLTDEAQRIGDHPDSTIIVLADEEMGLAMLQAIGDTMGELGIEPPSILVNDAVHGTPDFYLALPPPLLDVLRRVGPVASLPQQATTPPTAPATTTTLTPATTTASAATAAPGTAAASATTATSAATATPASTAAPATTTTPATTTPETTTAPDGSTAADTAGSTAVPAETDASAAPETSVPADQVTPAPVGPFASNAFDCVNLIALAAGDASSDDPRAIADGMRNAANSGVPCASYPECAEIGAQGLDFNYNGVNGQNTLYQFDANGDLARAFVMTYRVLPDTGFEQENGAFGVTELS